MQILWNYFNNVATNFGTAIVAFSEIISTPFILSAFGSIKIILLAFTAYYNKDAAGCTFKDVPITIKVSAFLVMLIAAVILGTASPNQTTFGRN